MFREDVLYYVFGIEILENIRLQNIRKIELFCDYKMGNNIKVLNLILYSL